MSRKRDIARLIEDVKALETKVKQLECDHPRWEFRSTCFNNYEKKCAYCGKIKHLTELNWLKGLALQTKENCNKVSGFEARIARIEKQEKGG